MVLDSAAAALLAVALHSLAGGTFRCALGRNLDSLDGKRSTTQASLACNLGEFFRGCVIRQPVFFPL
jgi:hypothetical protein